MEPSDYRHTIVYKVLAMCTSCVKKWQQRSELTEKWGGSVAWNVSMKLQPMSFGTISSYKQLETIKLHSRLHVGVLYFLPCQLYYTLCKNASNASRRRQSHWIWLTWTQTNMTVGGDLVAYIWLAAIWQNTTGGGGFVAAAPVTTMGNWMVTWSMTSRDPERSSCDPNAVKTNISKTAGDAKFSNNR